MITLLRIELRKLLPYRTFWVILAIYAVLLFIILYGASTFTVNGQAAGAAFYEFPGFWPKLTYTASYFNLLLGILLIISVTDEYVFRTLRQQVIDGYSRLDVVRAKYTVVLLLALVCALFVLLLGIFFGMTFGNSSDSSQMFSDAHYVLFYFVQAVGYMSLAMLIGFLIRKSGLAILAFLIYAKIVEPIIHYKTPDTIDQYFPMKVFSSLTPMPGQEMLDMVTGISQTLPPSQALAPTIVWITVFCFLSYLLLKNRDL